MKTQIDKQWMVETDDCQSWDVLERVDGTWETKRSFPTLRAALEFIVGRKTLRTTGGEDVASIRRLVSELRKSCAAVTASAGSAFASKRVKKKTTRVKALLWARDMSMNDVARQCGMLQADVSGFVNGRTTPNRDRCEAIAACLGYSGDPDELREEITMGEIADD